MFNIFKVILFTSVITSFAYSDDKTLKRIDDFRLGALNSKVKISFTSFVSGEETSKAMYYVFTNDKNFSFVFFMDKKNYGQRVLMTDNSLWFYSPTSQKAIRITPLQRAMGEASYGDIARMRFNGAYTIEKIEENIKIQDEEPYNQANTKELTTLLTLKGISTAVSYPTIRVWVNSKTYQPIMAEYVYGSGKASKLAIYGSIDAKNSAGISYISKLTYIDLLDTKKVTKSVLEDVEVVDKLSGAYFDVNSFKTAPVKIN